MGRDEEMLWLATELEREMRRGLEAAERLRARLREVVEEKGALWPRAGKEAS